MTNYLINVNGEKIMLSKGELDSLDSIQIDSVNFHLLENNQASKIKVLHSDFSNKSLTVSVNGNTYEVKIEDEYDQQVNKMGLLAVASQKVNTVKSPMPGLIVDVMVNAGDAVSEGTPLIVLSAMKMENIILSQGDGIVKSIEVKKDDAVEKGQLIIEME